MEGKRGKSSRGAEKYPSHTGAEGGECDQQTILTQSQNPSIVMADRDADIRFHEEKLRRLRLEKEQDLIQQVEQAKKEERSKLIRREVEEPGSKYSGTGKEKLPAQIQGQRQRPETPSSRELSYNININKDKGKSEEHEKQAQTQTDLQKENERLRQEMKHAEERHKIEMERQRNITECHEVERNRALEQMEELKNVQTEKQRNLEHLEEKQRKLEQDKKQLKQAIRTLEADKTNMTVSKAKKAEAIDLQNKIHEIEQKMENVIKEKKQIEDKYEQRIAGLEKESQEFVKKEDVEKLLREKQVHSDTPCPIHDEEILSKIRKPFVSYIMPLNILHLFHHYNRSVLTQQDIEFVRVRTSQNGRFHGAGELLSCLISYKDWFSCLIQVLRHPELKQGHVVDAMWDALGMGETRDKNLPIEEVKQKLKTAVTTLQMMKQFHSEDGIKCLTFIRQTYYDYVSDRDLRDLGDCLTDCGFVETCMKFLQDHLNSVTIQTDQIWPAIDKTLGVCWNCCGMSLKFAKKLVDLDGIKFFTEILRDRCYLDHLDRQRESRVMDASTLVLFNIATQAGVIDEFKDSRTVEALMSLIKCNSDIIKVEAMIALAYLVKEEKEVERKVKLIDPSDVISTLIQWITKALEDKKERRHQGWEAWTLTLTLTRMAVSDENKKKIIDGGGLPVFLKMLTHTEPDPLEQSRTARCVEQLSHDENIKQEIRDYPGLVPALEELKKSQVVYVRNSVVSALRIIQGEP